MFLAGAAAFIIDDAFYSEIVEICFRVGGVRLMDLFHTLAFVWFTDNYEQELCQSWQKRPGYDKYTRPPELT